MQLFATPNQSRVPVQQCCCYFCFAFFASSSPTRSAPAAEPGRIGLCGALLPEQRRGVPAASNSALRGGGSAPVEPGSKVGGRREKRVGNKGRFFLLVVVGPCFEG